jgi:hypothetical protein
MTPSPTAAPLSTIIALARAGALDHAWYQFSAAGYDAKDDDPAALTVKGRLLKDRALRASGEARRGFYLEAAAAYRRSAALRPGTYPLINAATLSLLAGNIHQAQDLANEVLERIAREPEEPETPYWRAATEAEAWLVLGVEDEARPALEAAIAAAPRAWEDHASTLRQFIAIQAELGADAFWLDVLRPPRTISFAGTQLGGEEIAAALERDNVGFGYGALGAGAEILAAEALVARGAELHVVLPADAASFAALFVDPQGGDWRARFDAALDAAESVQLVRPLGAPPEPGQSALAGEVARGAALLNAERLMGEAVHLDLGGAAGGEMPPGEARAPILSLLALGVGGGGEEGFEARLAEVREALALVPGEGIAPHLSGDVILAGYAGPAEAAAAARSIHGRLRDRMPLRIAAHHGLIPCVRDPFLGSLRPTEGGAAIVESIAGSIPADTICASADFAALLAGRGGAPGEACWIGELQAYDGGAPIGLYALRSGLS